MIWRSIRSTMLTWPAVFMLGGPTVSSPTGPAPCMRRSRAARETPEERLGEGTSTDPHFGQGSLAAGRRRQGHLHLERRELRRLGCQQRRRYLLRRQRRRSEERRV